MVSAVRSKAKESVQQMKKNNNNKKNSRENATQLAVSGLKGNAKKKKKTTPKKVINRFKGNVVK